MTLTRWYFTVTTLLFGVWCVVLSVSEGAVMLKILFVVAALLIFQITVFLPRTRFLVAPIQGDVQQRARITSVEQELCRSVGVPCPHVIVRDGAILAAVLARKGHAALVRLPTLLDALDDQQLRGIIAHEVSHFSAGDLAHAATLKRIVLGMYVIWLIGLASCLTLGSKFVPVCFAFFVPLLIVVRFLCSSSNRPRETRADSAAFALTHNAPALISAHDSLRDQRSTPAADLWTTALVLPAVSVLGTPALTSVAR